MISERPPSFRKRKRLSWPVGGLLNQGSRQEAIVPRVTELPIPRTPSVETGEVEALERLDQAIEQYLVHCQRSFVLHEAKPSDLFAAFQRFATDLLDVYAERMRSPRQGTQF